MIIYRTAGPWGPGVGANLTAPQVDGNFYDVSQRVQLLELNPPQPTEITSFTSTGNQLYINMSDGTVHGPFILPTVRWFFRGNWAPGVIYSRDDVVAAPDSAVYLVMFTHTSGATFSAGAADGQGHIFYQLILKQPAASMPTGGARGYVLTKNTDNNYDIVWAPARVPIGGEAGQVLQKNSETENDASWNNLQFVDLEDFMYHPPLLQGDYLRWDASVMRWINHPGGVLAVLSESSWDPVVGDDGAFMVLTNGTADTTILIPHNDNEPFPIGTELSIHQDGTGTVTIVGDTGVQVLKHAGFSNQLLGQYATATVKKTGNNQWRLFGLLAGA